MKTAQIIEYDFLGEKVLRNHKTKMFSLTSINKLAPGRQMNSFLRSDNTKGFISEICKQEGLTEKEVIDTKGTRGKGGGTWGHPLMAIKFALWINPVWEYQAMKWIMDNKCDFRDSVGDYYKEMCETIMEVLKPKDDWTYKNEAIMVNKVAGFKGKKRNEMTEDELKTLNIVQQLNIRFLKQGVKLRSIREKKLNDQMDLMKDIVIDIVM